ncbi:DUF3040 domain-containing protein [Nocardioides aequoreus]|uniref:DUF3040 domain-containing protein n=1 Tax=Nocardioides aequoreus TaxID=397278 RepID=UPI0004C4255E|nr:DUF3040 domain-containing protein [Nocardioides aequoreus]
MPLSEEELRLLEQMEQALAQEDPKFASTLRGSAMERTAKLRSVGALVVFVLGVAMLMGGAVSQQIWLAVLGFVVMVASATLGLAAWKGRHATAGAGQPGSPDAPPTLGLDDPPHRFSVVEGGRSDKRRSRPAKGPRRPRGARGSSGTHGTFMQRMEQRWERRRQQGF